MNRKLALGVLFILAIFTSATYINIVSAEEADQNSSPDVSTTIVISQVYSGGGSGTAGVTYKNDYVELLNVSSSPQSLNGLALQYGSATGNFGGSATQIFALPNFTLSPVSAISSNWALPEQPERICPSRPTQFRPISVWRRRAAKSL
jgi:hypothetical protein